MNLDELVVKITSMDLTGLEEISSIPTTSGVYTAWLKDDSQCFYVGRTKNLKNRIYSHFSGARGSDQFCLYVYDRYIYKLRCSENSKLTTNKVNRLTREWIQEKVKFKCLELEKSKINDAERFLKRKLRPILNPL